MKLQVTPQEKFFPMLYGKPEGADKKTWYFLKAEAGEQEAELYIYDFIGLFGVEAKDVVLALKDIKGANLTVRLNTPGGSVWDGIAIYNAIREHDGPVTVIIDALAASAGSLIAMAGEKIVMNKGSRIMIHDAWGITVGNAEDHLYTADRLNEVSADLAEIYAARTGIGKRMIRQMMKEETWMNAKQAKDAGFADEVSGESKADDKAEFMVPVGMFKKPDVVSQVTPGENKGTLGVDMKFNFQRGGIIGQTKEEKKAEEIPFDRETEERRLRVALA